MKGPYIQFLKRHLLLCIVNCEVTKYFNRIEFMYIPQIFLWNKPKDAEHHSTSAKLISAIN